MDAKEFLSVVENRKAYNDWLRDPVTKTVLEIIRNEGRFYLPPQATLRAETCISELGRSDGWNSCINRMETLDRAEVSGTSEAPMDYGAVDTLKNLYGEKYADESYKAWMEQLKKGSQL